MKHSSFNSGIFRCLLCSMISVSAAAQTDDDAIMMNKQQLCAGFQYRNSAWTEYWEGSFKRTNDNLKTVSTQAIMFGANYGISDRLNVMIMAPYVWTRATGGTLRGMKGVQDISAFVKWKALARTMGQHKIAVFAIGGYSTPSQDYVVDFLPLSIGLGSRNLIAKGMVDYQRKRMSVTASAAYIRRSNIQLDRDSYYDTELHLTNEVRMPNLGIYQVRGGYRGRYLIAEAVVTNMTTMGGFDITKNNMPFPSNRMNGTSAGARIKYTLPGFVNLSLLGSASQTVAGRNVGKAFDFSAGAFYAFYVSKRRKPHLNNQLL